MAIHVDDPTFGSVFLATVDNDVLTSVAGSDWLIGHAGKDTFRFDRGDGHDILLQFEQGVDKIEITGSMRQTSLQDTEAGTEVYYGGFGQTGPDHVLIYGVHGLGLADFAFV
ncbi:hypothetical protein E2C06_33675 [Dankookia rubra]|uniref:Calcium-binding protein n=1 Tax=Dankookia rubra TaxID=1442381 RepID=A0A4R5Q5T6_9PROT|nr:hypothetical protein [Dankookia rubra]TDH58240.1 hypothetical protein E2C06_33675 [Dankookia rubra]